jgi:diacylglycerol kinase family enzyme
MIGNCGTLQGGVTLLPDADPSDGELDMMLLEAEGLGQWLDTLRSFVWDNGIRRLVGKQAEAQSANTVTHARVRSLSVSMSRPRLLQVDGDGLGATSAFTIETQPAAVRVR